MVNTAMILRETGGVNALAVAVLERAKRDAARGDNDAAVWLLTEGAFWAGMLAPGEGRRWVLRWCAEHVQLSGMA